MANVNIKFNGKEYLLSCEDGQEEHLEELSLNLNKKFSSMMPFSKVRFSASLRSKSERSKLAYLRDRERLAVYDSPSSLCSS